MEGALKHLAGKKRIKYLFVRPPHHYWPIINQSDNFLCPLNYPTLAAWLRHRLDFVDVEILDCCVSEVGYKSLADEIRRRKPDVVGIGEKVVYANDALRTFRVVKSVDPKIVTMGGAHIFTHEPEWALRTCPELDYCMRYEAEIALEHFLRVAREGGDEQDTMSLCWLDRDGQFLASPLAPAIQNLDDLPPPAFDLVPLKKYSPFGMLWPQSATIQRSRGCVDTCRFCSWIAMENKQEQQQDGTIKSSPWFRSKSVEKVLEEVDILYKRFGIRYLFWVDATWNAGDHWLQQFCSEVIRRKYDLGWWAFTRYDLLPKQHRNGTLKLMVQAGFRHALVGVERPQSTSLNWLNKHRYGEDLAVETFNMMEEHYPEVFRQGTFITGLRHDSAESIQALLKHAHDCNLDFAAFHPCTPFPGTPLYHEAREKNWIEENDFGKYDMFYPIMRTEHLSREEVAKWTTWCQQNFVMKKPGRYASRMLSKYPVRRRLHNWFFFSINRVMAMQAWNAVTGKEKFEGFAGVNKLWRPSWYES
ncbi:MAG: Anaerobic magnesium-protoporphyrin IX monomethyl ester cyclase [Myxococcota bacterium]|nr:Anaerobic magnesium-protoporphyrin IX monomethyl ester cyclase [Myxococcota bacterium]